MNILDQSKILQKYEETIENLVHAFWHSGLFFSWTREPLLILLYTFLF